MINDGFESREELAQVVEVLSECANDAVYGRLFEIEFETSNLFSVYLDDGLRLIRLACMIEPGLRETCGEMDINFGKIDAISEYSQQLSNDGYDRLGEIVFDTRRAYMTIGTFIGAQIADPSGRVVRCLGKVWMRQSAGSRKDLKQVVNALIKCAEDAIFGRLFEIDFESSNLFPDERTADLAYQIAPYLKTTRGKVDLDFERVRERSKHCREIATRARKRLEEIISDTRRAYMTIGMFIGARAADPSGRVVRDLGKGWVNHVLAQPRCKHLRASKRPLVIQKNYAEWLGQDDAFSLQRRGILKTPMPESVRDRSPATI